MEEGTFPEGLTALHVAVLKNDYDKVRTLLHSREYGVDVRSSTGATPLMMASLFGRTRIFFYLMKKRADFRKFDDQNLAALQYAKGPVTSDLIRRYQDVDVGEPRKKGRRSIYNFLKTVEQASRSISQPQRALGAPSPDTQLPREQSSEAPAPETIFLRSHDGSLQLIGVQRLASTNVDIDLGRKSVGVIRGKNEPEGIYTFAVSGWSGVKGDNVLCNKEYSGLVRRVCSIYNFELTATWFDCRWRGDPAEKKGCYLSAHAEKQLGIWVLMESMSQALGTKQITIENIARLKELSEDLPVRLRETQIELDHEPCSSCIKFLTLLRQEAGLVIEWSSRGWFVEGQRTMLRRPESYPVRSRIPQHDDYILVETEEDGDSSSVTMGQEDGDDDDAAADQDGAADPSLALTAAGVTHRGQPRGQLRRHASDPYPKRCSPIVEPPQNRVPRWPEIDVRPRPPVNFRDQLWSRFGYNSAANELSREPSAESEVVEYEAEKILDHNSKDKEYKVKWREGSPTWEPVENLSNSKQLIEEYWESIGEVDEGMQDVDFVPEDS